jgi:CRISPR-associated protein Cmr1
MFLSGADGQTPELRAPSIKGAMRFWWRAMHGHLPLKNIFDQKDKKKIVIKGLKNLETEIFGGGGDNAQRSSFSIQVYPKSQQIPTGQYSLVPHRNNINGTALDPGNLFEVKLSLYKNTSGSNTKELGASSININKIKALFMLTCYLGGFGKRSRRGMGSIEIEEINGGKEGVPRQVELQHIQNWISEFSPYYQISGEKIVNVYSGGSPQYGYIREIQLGVFYFSSQRILEQISSATHNTKQKHGLSYDPSMGYAQSYGRFASPVIASVVSGGPFRPIITTLNLAPDRNANQASLRVQQDFKNEI